MSRTSASCTASALPAIRSPEDYEHCVLEILRAVGGKASWGQLYREFERQYTNMTCLPTEFAEGRGEIVGNAKEGFFSRIKSAFS